MDFTFGEEQESLRELAARIVGDLVGHDRSKALEAEDAAFDADLWRALAKANLLGVAIPEEHGGMGFGLLELAILLEELGRGVAPVPAWPTLVLGALPIAGFGSSELAGRWLPRVASGEAILTAALQEEDSEDPLRPSTQARPDAGEFRLDGRKLCVPGAGLAARILVPARTPGAGIGLFLVDPGAEGVALEPVAMTHREPTAHVRLDGVRVPASEVLAAPDTGEAALRWLMPRATIGLCALQVGVSDRALRITSKYVSEREQFGRPVGSFQAVHQRAADAYIHLDAMRLTALEAVWRLDNAEFADEAVAIAKYWAAEGGQVIGNATQHLHGGIGVDLDYPIHRHYLWARQIELALGSGQRQLAAIGAAMAEAAV